MIKSKNLLIAVAALLITAIAAIQVSHLQQQLCEYSNQVEQRSMGNYYAYNVAGYQASTAYWTRQVFN